MTTSKNRPKKMLETFIPPPGWRFRIGVTLFVLAMLFPLASILIATLDLNTELKATLIGLSIAGIPEILTVLSIAMLGKPGFAYVKNCLWGLLRRYGPPAVVGKTRYYIGLVILFFPAVFALISINIPLSWFPSFWLPISISLDIIFICSFFVLGGDFWDKFQALFIYKAKAQLPE